MRIFVDTGAFIALADASDEHHEEAKKFYSEAKEQGARFVTTNFVVCETLNYLRGRVSHSLSVKFREKLYQSSAIEVIHISEDVEDEAFGILKRYADKDFSFTDCTSFAAMRALKIKKAFAFDRHFEQYSDFKKLP